MCAWISTAGTAASPDTTGKPPSRRRLHDLSILLGDDEGHSAREERFADALADAAVARHHDVAGEPLLVDRGRQLRQRVVGALERAGELGPPPDGGLERLDGVEEQRVDRDRQQRAGQDEVLAFARQDTVRHAEAGEDERELADLSQTGGDGECGVDRIAKGDHQQERRDRLPEHDYGRTINTRSGRSITKRGSKSMPTETKKRTEKASRSGSDSSAAVTQGRFAQHHAGEESAQRERDAEELRRAVGDADRRGDHAQSEELARSGARHLPQQPRKETASDHQHQRHEQAHPSERERQGAAEIAGGGSGVAAQPGREGGRRARSAARRRTSAASRRSRRAAARGRRRRRTPGVAGPRMTPAMR
jgi:hypothetical protein